MTSHGLIVWPGPGRITLALLAVIPAVMAYPWSDPGRSPRGQWALGVAIAVVLLLFSWWRGQHVTTILARRWAMLRHRRRPVSDVGDATRSTALLSIEPLAADADSLPLPLIAEYLDRYGIRAEAIRISSRHNGSGAGQTWIGLTVSAVQNLTALRARSPRIPLPETAQVAARRLADHLRELGWAASPVDAADAPRLVTPHARETWRGVREEDGDYVAAYRINAIHLADSTPSDTLAEIWSYPARETWTVLEIAGAGSGRTLAAACAFRTVGRPEKAAPLAGLTPHAGNHRRALAALDPVSTRPLAGRICSPADVLGQLSWPVVVTAAAR